MTTNLHADQIDFSDITDRVEELRDERDEHDHDEDGNRRGANNWATDFADDAEELADLEKLLDETRGNGGDHQWEGDWYPGLLIAEDYFETAMDDLIEEIGELPKNIPSYLTVVVNYDALRMDYTEVEFDGVTYLYR